MTKRKSDPRIGYKNEDGKTIWPTMYWGNVPFSHRKFPDVTRFHLGEGCFVVLPPGVARMPDEGIEELRAIAGVKRPRKVRK